VTAPISGPGLGGLSNPAATLLRLVGEAPVGVVVWRLTDEADDASLVLVLANAMAERYLSRPLQGELERRFSEVFPTVPHDRRKRYADVVRTGVTYATTTRSVVTGIEEAYTISAAAIGERCVAIYFENLGAQRRTEERALEANRFLDSIIENLPNMIFVKDAEHLRFERFNKAGEDLLGLPREQLIGKSDYDFFPKDQADAFIADDQLTLRAGTIKDIPEEPIQTANGLRWLHTRKVPILDSQGRPKFLLGISEDITERRDADAQLLAAKEAAETANRELEAFSYSVAHDLRAPLRAVDGFSQALIEDFGGSLGQEAAGYLQRIRRAATRMGELIDDLLQLSRVTRAELNRHRVDVSAMVESVAANLRPAQAERKVDVRVQPGVVADADARLLRIALENLMSNAHKFSGRRPDASIEFGTSEHQGSVAYFVRDNGVGFDMAHARRLFSAFERLHPRDFEGSGIGLAIVQRIVSRHGGRVWAESAVDRGATFYFTLGQTK
jgi:hypothetical protein